MTEFTPGTTLDEDGIYNLMKSHTDSNTPLSTFVALATASPEERKQRCMEELSKIVDTLISPLLDRGVIMSQDDCSNAYIRWQKDFCVRIAASTTRAGGR
jgi:hypothetical protein